jgi:ATP-dependent DNA ligase
VIKQGSEVRLFSRRGNQFTQFPSLVQTLSRQTGSFILDGEIVALDENGRQSLNTPQNAGSGVDI